MLPLTKISNQTRIIDANDIGHNDCSFMRISSVTVLPRTFQSRDRYFDSVYLKLHSKCKSKIMSSSSYIYGLRYDIWMVNISFVYRL